ncbi:Rossmann-like and DUF2520 domain-containing protein [Acinetobacter sp.]|uniref:Rossmann-like and DUF2520 domain-containing protein n=1 Tax=Acinetobacter sp. TaxID=472 RepID=UPI0031DD4AAD
MKISFIGSGRVATHLACAFKKVGHEIFQIYSPHHAQQLAHKVNAVAIDQLQRLDPEIDVLIIAVNDQAIASIIKILPDSFKDVCVVHTSGSTDLKVLTEHHANSGVLYPLQTFSFEKEVVWADVPLLIEGNTTQGLSHIHSLANSLSKKIYHYSSTQRLNLHLAAVFACNFSNYCYDMANQITEQAEIDFSLLHPLILETANKATQFTPREVQTGPAKRHDQNILALHQQLLEQQNLPDLLDVYQQMSQGIEKHA